jgi:hypothetical protein
MQKFVSLVLPDYVVLPSRHLFDVNVGQSMKSVRPHVALTYRSPTSTSGFSDDDWVPEGADLTAGKEAVELAQDVGEHRAPTPSPPQHIQQLHPRKKLLPGAGETPGGRDK